MVKVLVDFGVKHRGTNGGSRKMHEVACFGSIGGTGNDGMGQWDSYLQQGNIVGRG